MFYPIVPLPQVLSGLSFKHLFALPLMALITPFHTTGLRLAQGTEIFTVLQEEPVGGAAVWTTRVHAFTRKGMYVQTMWLCTMPPT